MTMIVSLSPQQHAARQCAHRDAVGMAAASRQAANQSPNAHHHDGCQEYIGSLLRRRDGNVTGSHGAAKLSSPDW